MPQGSSEDLTRRAIEAYFHGLETGDVSHIPLAENVCFVGPTLPDGVRGEPEVRALLADVAAGFKTFVAERIFVDGDHACAPFQFTLHDPNVPAISGVDCFRVVSGKIVNVRPYYDPRPLLAE